MLNNREQIPNILSYNSIGCELGIFLCEYSDVLLSSQKFKKLYLVDTFCGNVGSGDKKGNNIRFFDGQYLLSNAKNKYKNMDSIHIEQNDSVSFLMKFPPEFFDFIYIDTVHTYTHLIRELEESKRVIKSDGFICGHDYNYDAFPGVVEAVNDFCNKYNFTFTTTTEDFLESFIIRQ